MKQQQESLWSVVKGYFNALPDKENEKEIVEQITSDTVFHGARLWVLIFAILMASLGLNVNSTAVVIGAMLISPLMGPITGIGLGVGINDLQLLTRSFKNFSVSTVIGVITATLYFTVTPITEAQSELLARTSPTLYDVLIALCGGAAGIIAISTKGKGNVIPGVAIATALMPPLCTAGYGLAMGKLSYFLGAFYLYFINSVFICAATLVGVRMLKFRHKHFVDPVRFKRVKIYIIAIVVATMIPAAYMTMRIIKHSIAQNNVMKFVKSELEFKGTQIVSHVLNEQDKTLDVVAVGRTILPASIKSASERMRSYRLDDYKLHIIQGSLSDSTLMSRLLHSATTATDDVANRKLLQQSAEMNDLERKVAQYEIYEQLSTELRGEVKSLWPDISHLSLSMAVDVSMDTDTLHRYVVAIAGCRRPLAKAEGQRLGRWIKARVETDSVRVIIVP
jgi:uncharacterized hydrophobic protein (TIGR00271 family)